MQLERVLFIGEGKFTTEVRKWTDKIRLESDVLNPKDSDNAEVDGFIVIHEDHNITKVDQDMKSNLDKKNIPTFHVDINGTLQASASSVLFWLERNNTKKLLISGAEPIVSKTRFDEFMKHLIKAISPR